MHGLQLGEVPTAVASWVRLLMLHLTPSFSRMTGLVVKPLGRGGQAWGSRSHWVEGDTHGGREATGKRAAIMRHAWVLVKPLGTAWAHACMAGLRR